MSAETISDHIENVLVIRHDGPFGPADPETIDRHIEGLQRPEVLQGRSLTVVESAATLEGTLAIFEKQKLEKGSLSGTLVDVAGGDGTLHDVYMAMSQLKLGPESPLTSIGGGGACCAATELHPDKESRYQPGNIFDGRSLDHSQLVITAEHESIAPDDERRQLSAVVFATFGFTAKMCRLFNQDEFRASIAGKSPETRLYEQAKMVNRDMKEMKKSGDDTVIEIEDNFGVRHLGELAIPNGKVMAAAFRFRGVRLLRPGYGRLEIAGVVDKRAIAKAAAMAALGIFDHQKPYGIQEFIATKADESDIEVEVDGEAHQYPSGTKFRIEQAPSNVSLLTTDKEFAKAA